MQNHSLVEVIKERNWKIDELNLTLYLLNKAITTSPNPIPSKVWLAGGALRRAALRQDIFADADVDLFFQDIEGCNAMGERLRAIGAVGIGETKFASSLLLEHKVLLDDCDEDSAEIFNIKIQLIKKNFYPTLDDVLQSFDYTICQLGLEIGSDVLIVGDSTLNDIGEKLLILNKTDAPTAAINRLFKFRQQGFKPVKVIYDILKTVADNPSIVENEKPVYADEILGEGGNFQAI